MARLRAAGVGARVRRQRSIGRWVGERDVFDILFFVSFFHASGVKAMEDGWPVGVLVGPPFCSVTLLGEI